MHRARQGALRAGGRSVSVGGTIGGVITGATHPQEAAALGAAALGTAGAARIARAYLGSNRLARGGIERGLNPGAGNRVVNTLLPPVIGVAPSTAAVTGNALLDPDYRQKVVARR